VSGLVFLAVATAGGMRRVAVLRALDGEHFQDAALRQQLEQMGKHDLVLGDHDVA